MSKASDMVELERPPITERAILIRLALPTDTDEEVKESLDEIGQLAWTAGADVVARFVQRRAKPCPSTLVGKGKLEEIRLACDELEADLVIFDSDLTPAQGAKLTKSLDIKVVDRTQLILDIFAQRAHTNEGKHQVELAQLQYRLPRLTGRGAIMRQYGGGGASGIATRGPGEQKLEVDRRVIRRRINRLRGELDEIRKRRGQQRKKRQENRIPTIALVGYTNAGKSSLLKRISGADVFIEDKLFATLDPTARRCELPSGGDAVFVDTVGFIRKLPHTLVAAFRATLEEVNESDLVLVVADAAHSAVEDHLRAVHETLREIGADDKPIITVLNKTDIADPHRLEPLRTAISGDTATVSAATGEGVDRLLQQVGRWLESCQTRVVMHIPQSDAAVVSRVHEEGHVLAERYEGNTVVLEAEVGPALLGRYSKYIRHDQ